MKLGISLISDFASNCQTEALNIIIWQIRYLHLALSFKNVEIKMRETKEKSASTDTKNYLPRHAW